MSSYCPKCGENVDTIVQRDRYARGSSLDYPPLSTEEQLKLSELEQCERLRGWMGGEGELLTVEQVRELWEQFSADFSASWLMDSWGMRGNFSAWLAHRSRRAALPSGGATLSGEERAILQDFVEAAEALPDKYEYYRWAHLDKPVSPIVKRLLAAAVRAGDTGEDTKRLDWLATQVDARPYVVMQRVHDWKHVSIAFIVGEKNAPTLREALDAARALSSPVSAPPETK